MKRTGEGQMSDQKRVKIRYKPRDQFRLRLWNA